MTKFFSRLEILDRLQKQVDAGKSVLAFGAGTGLTARCAELGGADLIAVYTTAFYRMHGKSSLLAWLAYSDCNEHMLTWAPDVVTSVKETPCIAGLGAQDPRRNMDYLIDDMVKIGFSGITNEPFVGMYGPEFGAELEAAGIGFSKEVELIALAHKKNLFTVGFAFDTYEAERMAEAGADVLCAIVGLTTGGLTGAREKLTIEKATDVVNAITEAAKKVNPAIHVLNHGGPFKDPVSVGVSLKDSIAVGHAAGSSGERMPTEKAVIELVKMYKGNPLPAK